GDVVTAERKTVDVNQPSGLECRNCGGAGAHIDHGRAQISFIVGKDCQPRDIGSGCHGLDVEMTALHREHQVAGGGDIGGGHVHVHTDPCARHAARVADAVAPVD